jgi:FKBP-type peptidyl-prolyl cis-trans isomerase FklB
MKNGLRMLLAGVLIAGTRQLTLGAEDKPAFKDEKEKVSYSLGVNIGNSIKRSGYDVDVDVVAGAIKDVIKGGELRMTDQQVREALMAYQRELNAKREEERKKAGEKNRQAGEAFLAENKKKPGIATHMVELPDGKTAEFQYKVLTEGSGPYPKNNDTVSVNYRGTLIDGKEFDSSAKHGGPAKFQVNRVVKGWTEALQMMKPGSKWEVYLPSSLAYGDAGSPPMIEPGATLIFEIELVGIDTPQPLTSDIIRVPSAEELKAGAKIEVIKPEDVEKRAKEEAEKAQKAQKQP